jgi:hypothetical protein
VKLEEEVTPCVDEGSNTAAVALGHPLKALRSQLVDYIQWDFLFLYPYV